MADHPIRVAIIGVGHWGAEAHLPAFAALDDVEVRALVDPQLERATVAARRYGVARVEPDADALFRDPDGLDAVAVVTPDDTHRDLAVAACRAGLHMLCEKPLAYDVAQAVEMVEAARRSERIGKIGFLYRHSPIVTRMKELVDEGYIGEVQLFQSIGINAQFIDPARPIHWKMQREHAPGGVFVEYGSHTIDLALWFGGPIRRVVAHGVTLIRTRPNGDGGVAAVDVDDAASWTAAYASGGEALFRTGWASLPVGDDGTRLFGPKGSLAWRQTGVNREVLVGVTRDDPTPRMLLEYAPDVDPAVDEGPFPLGLLARYNARLVESFIDDIRAGAVSWPSFADGLAVQHVLAAIRTSLDEGRWVNVPTVGEVG